MAKTVINKNIFLRISLILLTVNGIVFILRGIFLEILGNFGGSFNTRTGGNWEEFLISDHEVANYIIYSKMLFGFFVVLYGILLTVLVWKFFRNGERWAWYVMWLFPITWIIFFFSTYLSFPEFYPQVVDILFDFDIIATITMCIVILLPFRSFFPKKNETG